MNWLETVESIVRHVRKDFLVVKNVIRMVFAIYIQNARMDNIDLYKQKNA